MNHSCDECIYRQIVDTVNESYIICTNDKYKISFPDFMGKCKYQVKKGEKKNDKLS
jgi:hypothetical protein